MKARRAVDPVAIEERHGRIAEIGGTLDDRFRERGALQKAEGGGGVELDVRRHVFNTKDTIDTKENVLCV